MHSCEYASRVIQSGRFGIPPGCCGAGRPLNRVQARSNEPPPEMHRTALPEEPAAELLQHPIGLHEPAPEPPDGGRVVRCVRPIGVEPDRVCDLVRLRMTQPRRQAERAERIEIAAVEVGDRLRLKRQRRLPPVAGADSQTMIDEIEVGLERPITGRHGGRAQPARRHVQGHLPPVVLHRRQVEACLADDLRPEMKRVADRLPRFEGQGRPRLGIARHDYRARGAACGAGSIIRLST